MKSKEELNALREEVESVGKKMTELSEEELKEITGGMKIDTENVPDWLRPILQLVFG